MSVEVSGAVSVPFLELTLSLPLFVFLLDVTSRSHCEEVCNISLVRILVTYVNTM